MTTIVEFIEARITEKAEAASEAKATALNDAAGDGALWVVTGSDHAVGIDYDPDGELRLCDALRAVVAYVEAMVSPSRQYEAEGEVLEPIAAIWSDHPDYRKEWSR